jgi:hypothetical protein
MTHVISGNPPLLLESDPVRLAKLEAGLRDAGILVTAARRIGDIERWPVNTFVITDVDRFSPWWREVGATDVIVLANTAEKGVAACQRGATTWLPRKCTVKSLVATINAVLSAHTARHSAKAARGVSALTRVRIIQHVAGIVDGISLSALVPGFTYDLEPGLARYLVSCGAAEENASVRPVTAVPADDPYIAHLTGGIVVVQTDAPPQDMAADKPSKRRRLRRRQGP